MQSPLPTISLIALYVLFVNFGPRFMKNRAPLEIKPLLFVFNAAIVVLYVYLTREVSSKVKGHARDEGYAKVKGYADFGQLQEARMWLPLKFAGPFAIWEDTT